MAKKNKTSPRKITVPSRRRVAPPRGRALAGAAALDLHRCALFLEHEARLLDESKFDDWLALFTADAWYWVPSEPNQNNPKQTQQPKQDLQLQRALEVLKNKHV